MVSFGNNQQVGSGSVTFSGSSPRVLLPGQEKTALIAKKVTLAANFVNPSSAPTSIAAAISSSAFTGMDRTSSIVDSAGFIMSVEEAERDLAASRADSGSEDESVSSVSTSSTRQAETYYTKEFGKYEEQHQDDNVPIEQLLSLSQIKPDALEKLITNTTQRAELKEMKQSFPLYIRTISENKETTLKDSFPALSAAVVRQGKMIEGLAQISRGEPLARISQSSSQSPLSSIRTEDSPVLERKLSRRRTFSRVTPQERKSSVSPTSSDRLSAKIADLEKAPDQNQNEITLVKVLLEYKVNQTRIEDVKAELPGLEDSLNKVEQRLQEAVQNKIGCQKEVNKSPDDKTKRAALDQSQTKLDGVNREKVKIQNEISEAKNIIDCKGVDKVLVRFAGAENGNMRSQYKKELAEIADHFISRHTDDPSIKKHFSKYCELSLTTEGNRTSLGFYKDALLTACKSEIKPADIITIYQCSRAVMGAVAKEKELSGLKEPCGAWVESLQKQIKRNLTPEQIKVFDPRHMAEEMVKNVVLRR